MHVTTTTLSRTVTVTIPEGYTVVQIGSLLEKNGVCSKADYLSALNTIDYSQYYPNVAACVAGVQNLCYTYEGYQFPNTYEFNRGMNARDAAGKLMRGAQNNIIAKAASYQYNGMSLHEIVTLASLIEIEAASSDDRAKISSVLHNRLKVGMQLQVDCATKYLTVYVNPSLPDELRDTFNSYYNTYKCPGLPAGPICNPGADALYAAVHPADTDYLYFHSENGTYVFETEQDYIDRTNTSSD